MKEKKSAQSNILILQIDSDGLSLSVYDKPGHLFTSKRIDMEVYKLEIPDLLAILKEETDFKTEIVEIIVESYQYSFIPVDIFKIEEATDFLLFEHKPKPTDSILYNKIPEFGIVNVFAIPGAVLEVVNQLFPKSAIEHHISRFITENISLRNENCVYCRAGKTRFDAVVIKNGNIALINSFEYKTPEDFLYFVLNIYDKLSMNQQKHPVYLQNTIKNPDIELLLKTYLTTNLL
ncbi:MAG: DUF3822 family protein [Paludibacter sp.]